MQSRFKDRGKEEEDTAYVMEKTGRQPRQDSAPRQNQWPEEDARAGDRVTEQKVPEKCAKVIDDGWADSSPLTVCMREKAHDNDKLGNFEDVRTLTIERPVFPVGLQIMHDLTEQTNWFVKCFCRRVCLSKSCSSV